MSSKKKKICCYTWTHLLHKINCMIYIHERKRVGSPHQRQAVVGPWLGAGLSLLVEQSRGRFGHGLVAYIKSSLPPRYSSFTKIIIKNPPGFEKTTTTSEGK